MIRKRVLSIVLLMLVLSTAFVFTGCKEVEKGVSDWKANGGDPAVSKQEEATVNIVEFGAYPQSKAEAAVQSTITSNVTIDPETGLWNEYVSDTAKAKYDLETGYFIYTPIVDGKEQAEQYYMSAGDNLYLVEPIKWAVVEKNASESVAISLKVLDGGRLFSDLYGECTWGTSTMRDWLNGINDYDVEKGQKYKEQLNFLNRAFSDAEISKLKKVKNACADNATYGTAAGSETEDLVYFLSNEEFKSIFDNDATINAMAYATDYAAVRGTAVGKNNEANWWLRDPGAKLFMLGVDRAGSVSEGGFAINDMTIGVRPVITVETSALKAVEQ